MDSPVLKPPLIRFSSARLIGAAQQAADDGEIAVGVPRWVDALAGAGDASEQPHGPTPVDDGSTAPRADGRPSRRLVEDATTRLRAIEAEVAAAEARLAETQALLETLEREANLACALVEDARQQAAAIREGAQQEGYQAGMAQAETAMADRVAAIAALAEGAVRARAEFMQRSEPEIIDLAFEIARKVIGEHLTLDKDAVAEVATRALEAAGQADVYYLHLHPDDVETVQRHVRRDALGMPLEVVPDDRLAPGDCLVRTAHGRVDACIETQLREIREQMVGAA